MGRRAARGAGAALQRPTRLREGPEGRCSGRHPLQVWRGTQRRDVATACARAPLTVRGCSRAGESSAVCLTVRKMLAPEWHTCVRPCYEEQAARRRMGDYAAPWEACLLPLDKQVMDGRLSQGELFLPLTPVLLRV